MYSVEIVNKGAYLFNAKSKDSDIVIDTDGKGMTPPDVLLASLGSCIGVYIRKYAQGARLDLKGFRIRLDADFSKEKPVYFRKIDVSISLEGSDIDERRRIALLEFIKNCPVHNTLKNNPQVNIDIS